MNFIYDNINFIDNQEMIAKHQLAFNLKSIIVNYHNNKNLERFYRKINRHSKNISVYISNDSFIDFIRKGINLLVIFCNDCIIFIFYERFRNS